MDDDVELAINRAVIDCYGAFFRLQDAYNLQSMRCPDEIDLATTICNCKDSIQYVIDELMDVTFGTTPKYDDKGMKI